MIRPWTHPVARGLLLVVVLIGGAGLLAQG